MLSKIFRSLLVFLLILQASIAHAERTPPTDMMHMQLSFAPVVKQVSPAVVNIYTSRTVRQSRSHSPFMSDPFFSQFFGEGSRLFGQYLQPRVERALGSGVIIDASGQVITNAHVIDGAEEIKVVLQDGREFSATLVLKDSASDLALLQIEQNSDTSLRRDEPRDIFPAARLKPSEDLEVGDIVLAIGNPFGVGQTVTSGIVSAQGRSSLDY